MCSLCLKIGYHKGSMRKHETCIIQTCATGKFSFFCVCFVENMGELEYNMYLSHRTIALRFIRTLPTSFTASWIKEFN